MISLSHRHYCVNEPLPEEGLVTTQDVLYTKSAPSLEITVVWPFEFTCQNDKKHVVRACSNLDA